MTGIRVPTGLPVRKTLATFDWAFQPGLERAAVEELAGLAFVQRQRDLLITGMPGTGTRATSSCRSLCSPASPATSSATPDSSTSSPSLPLASVPLPDLGLADLGWGASDWQNPFELGGRGSFDDPWFITLQRGPTRAVHGLAWLEPHGPPHGAVLDALLSLLPDKSLVPAAGAGSPPRRPPPTAPTSAACVAGPASRSSSSTTSASARPPPSATPRPPPTWCGVSDTEQLSAVAGPHHAREVDVGLGGRAFHSPSDSGYWSG